MGGVIDDLGNVEGRVEGGGGGMGLEIGVNEGETVGMGAIVGVRVEVGVIMGVGVVKGAGWDYGFKVEVGKSCV